MKRSRHCQLTSFLRNHLTSGKLGCGLIPPLLLEEPSLGVAAIAVRRALESAGSWRGERGAGGFLSFMPNSG